MNEKRSFPGRRWLINSLRTLHLAGVVGVGAGLLGALEPVMWHRFGMALVLSGIGIVLVDSLGNRGYFRQVSSLVVVLKIALAAWMVFLATAPLIVFWGILALSVLSAHAPGSVRHRNWL